VKKFILLFCLIYHSAFSQNYSQLVNPFIGTGGHGHTFPGATVPFGMVQLSPDTRVDGSWDGCGGYHYGDSIIYGFSHTHLSGTGCSDYGDVMIMPTLGAPSFDNKKYSSRFSHLKEKANAGYYEVMLDDDKIKAQLTATTRTGIHQYTFPKTDTANIILDLLHRDRTLNCNLRVLDSVTISGFRISEAWAKEQHVYFIIRFSKPFKKMEYARAGQFQKELDFKRKEKAQGAYFQFDVSDGKPLMVQIALSSTDTEGAMKNLEAEAKHWDFEKYRKDAEQSWDKQLSKIEVQDDDKNKLTVFYTALYHCMIHPNVYMDVDGSYRGRDNKIHKAEGFTYFTVFSLWDTFRALHPLFTIIEPKRTNDILNTFLYQYDQSRRLPMWELSCNETDCMIGYHAVSVVADAFIKGFKNYDTLIMYDALKAAASYTGYGIPSYAEKGYLQADDESESVSKTLEYAYDDWCIAQVAQKMGQLQDVNHYLKRAQSYKNIFDPGTGFMRPKKNGGWIAPFDPSEVNNHYTEANSWQYSFFVPHDVNNLIRLHGGDRNFEKKLDDLFSASTKTTGREQADITGLIGQYAHGNEPSHHMAYLYNFVGRPAKTIEKVRKILSEFYTNAPDGLIGNEDCGQMSAWYVFSAMGFYPVCPGSPEYVLGSPYFKKIRIHLESGKSFEINASDLSPDKTVSGITLNSKSYLKSEILHDHIIKGGSLTFNYTSKSDTANKYGKAALMRPRTQINSNAIIPVPVIESKSKAFKDKQEIKINPGAAHEGNTVYTTDGSEPTKRSTLYFKAFVIDTTCVVKAKTYTSKDSSKTTVAAFVKSPNKWKIKLISRYSKQYSAGGDDGIIDGIYGDVNWRKGEWQGYQGQNFECVIDLGKPKTVRVISSNYLQDTRAWIIFPTEIEYFTSNDGKTFKPLAKISNPVPASDQETQLKKFEFHLPAPVNTRYVKIRAKNYGKLPEWHQGAGGDAYIFIDEIEVK
jgi:predicted alpha-1,2-mannosidase